MYVCMYVCEYINIYILLLLLKYIFFEELTSLIQQGYINWSKV